MAGRRIKDHFANSEHREMDLYGKGYISNIISHELKVPLTPIRGYADMLYYDKFGKLNRRQKAAVNVIRESTNQLCELVDKILHVARLESGKAILKKEKTDLKSLVMAGVEGVVSFAKTKGIKLTVKLPKDLPLVNADADEIIVTLTNLLYNAVKFTPKTGGVEVGAKETPRETLVWVKDNGIGIPKSEQKSIFEKFHKTRPSIEGDISGSGLGLYICKRIVEAHGGKIWVESKVGIGSAFYFTIPK